MGHRSPSRLVSRWITAAVAVTCVLCTGCPPSWSSPLSVSIAPAQLEVPIGYSVPLELRIPPTVTEGMLYWWIEGAGIGNATVGWLRETTNPLAVMYEPPAAVPTPATITVRARLESGHDVGNASATIQLVPAVAIVVTPPSARVRVGEQVRFGAEVIGGTGEQDVAWTLEGPADRAGLGSIDAGGLYTAPAMKPPWPVTVRATSVALPMASATASAEVRIKLDLEPATEVSLPFGATQQFTATVSGTPNTSVLWWLEPVEGGWYPAGSIEGDGRYTAPADARSHEVLHVQAQEDPEAAASVSIRLVPPPVIITGLSAPAAAGDPLLIQGSGFVGTPELRLPMADGSTLSLAPELVSAAELRATVPGGAASGLLSVVMGHGRIPATASPPASFTRLPRLRLHPAQRDLAAGESTAVEVAFLGGDPAPLAWVADVGSVTAGSYRAPDALASDGFARVTACVAGTAVCETTVLGLHPFRIEPAAGLVTPGGTLRLSAVTASGPAAASWRVVSGGGAVAGDGTYTASAALADAGTVVVAARVGGVEEQAEVGVRGAFPGVVARANDHADYRTGPFAGTQAFGVAVGGTRAYVVATRVADQVQPYHWIDVYDVADPTAPVWVTAVEGYGAYAWQPWVAGGALLVLGQDAVGRMGLSLYELASGVPRLVATDATLAWDRLASDGDLLYALDPLPAGLPAGPATRTLRVHDPRTGSLAPTRTISLPFPTTDEPQSLAVHGDRAFVGFTGFSARLLTFDVGGADGVLLSTVEDGGWPLDLRVANGILFAGAGGQPWGEIPTRLYDLATGVPEYLASLQDTVIVGARGTRLLGATSQSGTRIVELADPAHPRLVATLLTGLPTGRPAWAGDHVVQAEYAGGLAVYDVSAPGGPIEGTPFGELGLHASALLVSGDRMFQAVDEPAGPSVRILALDVEPPAQVGRIDGVRPQALAAGGGVLYAGAWNGLELWDVAIPSAPVRLAGVSMPATPLALAGDLLFVVSRNDLVDLRELVALDVSTPSAPVRLGSLRTDFYARELASAGTAVVAAAGGEGLFVFDASNPTSLVLGARLDLGAEVNDVETAGTIAYLATSRGLVLVDVADPRSPAVLSFACPPGWYPYSGAGPGCSSASVRVAVTQDLVWSFGDEAAGWDVRDPLQPRVASVGILHFCSEVAVRWPCLYTSGTGSCASTVWPVDVSAARNVVHLLPAPPGLSRP